MNYAEHHHYEPSFDNMHVLDVLNEMRHARVESSFIFSLMENCQKYEGLRDLMQMWYVENNQGERDKIISDLQEALDDIIDVTQRPQERPYLHYDDLDVIREDIINFKSRLKEEVDRHGGVSELARKTGIPQSSLSRFFTSTSMPRRTTLYKIAKALNLPESAVGFKWTS